MLGVLGLSPGSTSTTGSVFDELFGLSSSPPPPPPTGSGGGVEEGNQPSHSIDVGDSGGEMGG
jgi:hypothetical protein